MADQMATRSPLLLVADCLRALDDAAYALRHRLPDRDDYRVRLADDLDDIRRKTAIAHALCPDCAYAPRDCICQPPHPM